MDTSPSAPLLDSLGRLSLDTSRPVPPPPGSRLRRPTGADGPAPPPPTAALRALHLRDGCGDSGSRGRDSGGGHDPLLSAFESLHLGQRAGGTSVGRRQRESPGRQREQQRDGLPVEALGRLHLGPARACAAAPAGHRRPLSPGPQPGATGASVAAAPPSSSAVVTASTTRVLPAAVATTAAAAADDKDGERWAGEVVDTLDWAAAPDWVEPPPAAAATGGRGEGRPPAATADAGRTTSRRGAGVGPDAAPGGNAAGQCAGDPAARRWNDSGAPAAAATTESPSAGGAAAAAATAAASHGSAAAATAAPSSAPRAARRPLAGDRDDRCGGAPRGGTGDPSGGTWDDVDGRDSWASDDDSCGGGADSWSRTGGGVGRGLGGWLRGVATALRSWRDLLVWS